MDDIVGTAQRVMVGVFALSVICVGPGGTGRYPCPPPASAETTDTRFRLGPEQALLIGRLEIDGTGVRYGQLSTMELRFMRRTEVKELPAQLGANISELAQAMIYPGGGIRPARATAHDVGLMTMPVRVGAYHAFELGVQSSLPGKRVSINPEIQGFDPITVAPGEIVYVGEIRIVLKQGWRDFFFDDVEASLSIADHSVETIAEFRERYGQFHDVPVRVALIRSK